MGVKVTKLTEGWSNTNYLIQLLSKKVLLRIPGPFSDEYISRSSEKLNTQLAARTGICTEPYFFDPENGVMFRPFIDGHHPVEKDGKVIEQNLCLMIKALLKLHTSCPAFENSVDNLAVTDLYLDLIKKKAPSESVTYAELRGHMQKVRLTLSKLPLPIVPCHNDPNPKNFILKKGRDPQLIDWEYSGNGDPAWDLAYFLVHSDCPEDAEQRLLHTYDPRMKEGFRARIHVYKPFTEFILSTWICLQRVNGHFPVPEEQFREWENLGIDATKELLETEQYQTALATLEKI